MTCWRLVQTLRWRSRSSGSSSAHSFSSLALSPRSISSAVHKTQRVRFVSLRDPGARSPLICPFPALSSSLNSFSALLRVNSSNLSSHSWLMMRRHTTLWLPVIACDTTPRQQDSSARPWLPHRARSLGLGLQCLGSKGFARLKGLCLLALVPVRNLSPHAFRPAGRKTK